MQENSTVQKNLVHIEFASIHELHIPGMISIVCTALFETVTYCAYLISNDHLGSSTLR